MPPKPPSVNSGVLVLPSRIAPALRTRATTVASFGGHVLLPPVRRAGRDHAFGIERVLDRHRHAMQRPREVAARRARIERLGFGARARVAVHDDGVQHVVDGELALDERLDRLDGGNSRARASSSASFVADMIDELRRLVGRARRDRARRQCSRARRARPRRASLRGGTSRAGAAAARFERVSELSVVHERGSVMRAVVSGSSPALSDGVIVQPPASRSMSAIAARTMSSRHG